MDHVKVTQALREAIAIVDELKAALRAVSEAVAAEPAAQRPGTPQMMMSC
jgi:hypothetical protein